ncbi:MAG TPA: ATP-binding protein [Gemmatimonadaceae bacterium]|nr:ATP-binding protein [Gemmatimonadaceae bacterium]
MREPASKVLGKVQWEKWPISRGTEMARQYRRAVSTGEPAHFEQRFTGAGRTLWLEVDAYPSQTGLAVFFRNVTQRQVTTDRMHRLQHVTAALSTAITPAQVVNVTVEQGIAAMGARAGSVVGVSEDGTVLELVGALGYDSSQLAPWRRFPIDAQLPLAESVRVGQPVFLNSAEQWQSRYADVGPSRYADVGPWRLVLESQAWAVLPLVAGERVLGAMGLSFDTPRAFDDDERDFMLTLAQQCAQARERSRLYADAQAARVAAEHASNAKSQFLATMSHEIRTPINAIQGYAQLLEIGVASPITEQQHGYLTRLAGSATHLLGLINDVLDLAKVDAGELTVAHSSASLGVAVRTALDLTGPLASARGVRLVDACDGDAVTYIGDEHRVRQILINLLSNGVKFTSAGGSVTVSCGTASEAPADAQVQGEGPWAFVRVTDTGVGIPPEERARVFEAFHQVQSGRTRTQGGTGLGLTISLRLARLMNGGLTLESTPRVGSTFTLWLPSAGVALARQTESAEAHTARAHRAARSEAPALREVGEVLRDALDPILTTYIERLRTDPAIPRARELRRSQLEDHVLSLVSDIAQSLIILADAGAEAPSLLGDSTTILRSIAEAHGARRQMQGWPEAALEREYTVLCEVVVEAVRSRMREGDADASTALDTLTGLLRRAAAHSRQAWRHAAGAE